MEEQMIETIQKAGIIVAASRSLRKEAYPRLADRGEFVAFYKGDRRFRLSPETAIYIDMYLTDAAGGLSLEEAVTNPDHVRELIEVITS